MIKHIAFALCLALALGVTAATAANDTTAASRPAQNNAATANTQPAGESAPGKDAADPSLLNRAQKAAGNTADAAADMGKKAWDATADTAARAGGKAVDVGKRALDTVGDAAATAGNAVNNALNFENSDKSATKPEPDAER